MTNTSPFPKLRTVDKAYLAVLALYLAYSAFWSLGVVGALAGLVLVITGLVLCVRYLRIFGAQLLWPLRNRLRVTYMFIGVVPILLILILVSLGVYIATGQIASFLLTRELQRRAVLLAGPTELVAATPSAERDALIQRVFPFFGQQFPGIRLCAKEGQQHWLFPEGSECAFPPEGWERANGLVARDNTLYLWVHTQPNDAEVTVLMPVSREYLNGLVPGLVDILLMGRMDWIASDFQPSAGKAAAANEAYYRFAPSPPRSLAGLDPVLPKSNFADFGVLWQTNLTVDEWSAPGVSSPSFLTFNSRPSAVWGVLSTQPAAPGTAIDLSQWASVTFVVVCIAFLIVEGFSLVAGMRLSGAITEAVENLYEGTQHVMRGEFQHRVRVQGDDQLADLATSFNRMSENLETLVVVSKEKERMQSELEIAREVQAGLYPREAPKFENIELVAMSQPARMASGDYFDYLRLEDNRAAFAIGDVAGKGISAALLMASLQSTMRAQLRPYLPPPRGAAETWLPPQEDLSTALMVTRLNQQIHQFTSASKYATFFFGVYDDRDGFIRYTNAGHLPPLLIRNGKVQRLNVDGLVVGAFAFASYEESSLQLESGDVLVLYTDGISEPENEYGEEYGEERLRELLLANAHRDARDLADIIVAAVREWVGAAEQFDDITLLIVKKL